MLENVLCTACGVVMIALQLALHQEAFLPKSTFLEDLFWWEIHGLDDFLILGIKKPAIVHVGLLSTGLEIHVRSTEGIFCIYTMPLQVVNEKEGLVSWTMDALELQNYFCP